MRGRRRTRPDAAILRRIGRVPRILNALFLAISVVVALIGGSANPNLGAQVVIVAIPGVVFLLSFRIRLTVTGDFVIFRSYLRTYKFRRFPVYEFDVVLYSGFWNRWNEGGRWLNFNSYMLVARPEHGGDVPLPASVGGPRGLRRVADYLNHGGGHAARRHEEGPS